MASTRTVKFCEKIHACIPFIAIYAILLDLIFIGDSCSIRYPYRYFGLPTINNVLVMACWVVVEHFINQLVFGCMTFLWIFIFTLYSISCNFWLNVLTYEFKKTGRSHEQPLGMIHTYKQMQILNMLYNDIFSMYLSPIFTMSIIVFHVGELNSRSQEFIRLLKDSMGVGGKMQVKALSPIGVQVGSIFVIKRFTALAIIYIVSNITWNCLLLQ
ncbi:unnamed protein product [Allacma fusca]|uniref:Uncharacterized protein n=1 Tax=Allacma fusca TaxID=39272 RepID=A0A8J2K7F4_9HEXA|nr:unnamed protein product [Allacma fusca]